MYLDKTEVRVDGAILGNQVPLLLILRRPIYFNYEIEFIDIKNGVLDTVEGKMGKTRFFYNLKVYRNCMGVIARFKIGNITGPKSEVLHIETTGMLIISHTIKIVMKVLIFK